MRQVLCSYALHLTLSAAPNPNPNPYQVLCSYALHLLDAEALGATLRALARGALRGSRAPVLLSKVIHPPLSTTP